MDVEVCLFVLLECFGMELGGFGFDFNGMAFGLRLRVLYIYHMSGDMWRRSFPSKLENCNTFEILVANGQVDSVRIVA